jgi:DNA-binding NtrC family response regulator
VNAVKWPARSGRQSLLVVDDDAAVRRLLKETLAPLSDALDIYTAESAEDALDLMARARPGFVLLDLVLPGVEGFDLLVALARTDPFAEIVLLTGHSSMESAVEAIQIGASDYIAKPVRPERLRERVQRWLSLVQAEEKAAAIDPDAAEVFDFEGLVGRSPQMLDLRARIVRVAPHFANALVVGETGTGKEIVARALHRLGPNPEGPFVVCNCAAVTETLFESTLFGHMRGAFTGAVQNHKGYLAAAAGGTVFLDEIGETPLASQAKLLRFLQNREIQPLGATVGRQVDVRVVAATNRSLPDMVADRTFREDLYYRLASVALHVPPLRDRREDIPLLAHHFLNMYGVKYGRSGLRFARRAQSFMLRYRWPGNVRELESAISYAAMMTDSESVDIENLPDSLREALMMQGRAAPAFEPLESVERRHVMEVLAQLDGNRAKAAEVLGIGRTTLYRLLKREEEP